MTTLPDRVRGTLLGLAAGDRIGGPIRMALLLANSLLTNGEYRPEDVVARYLGWWKTDGFDTGPVADEVFRLLDTGVANDEAVRQVNESMNGLTAGCNPAHRSPPLAMAAFVRDEELERLARREARLTHAHPLAGGVAAQTILLCRRLIRGEAWDESDEGVELSNGGFAPDVFRAAVHFVGAHPTFTDALLAALRFAGPANYCPVLAGAIAGARWGASGIPAACIDAKLREQIERIANQFAEGWRE